MFSFFPLFSFPLCHSLFVSLVSSSFLHLICIAAKNSETQFRLQKANLVIHFIGNLSGRKRREGREERGGGGEGRDGGRREGEEREMRNLTSAIQKGFSAGSSA